MFAVLALSLVCALAARAAGPDEQYLDIYNEILQADSLQQNGRSALAAEKYAEAQSTLQKLQTDYPRWNPDIVHFRLDYLAERLQELAKFAPPSSAHAPAALAPTNLPAATAQQEIAVLQEQLRALTAANGELENKLKEALSVQPAAVSPRELIKAGERIVELEKECDLLKTDLEQAKASKAASGAPAEAKALAAERDKLKEELAARTKELADAKARGKADLLAARAALKDAQRERDELAKKLAATQPGGDNSKSRAPSPVEPVKPVAPANPPPPNDPPAPAAPATNAAPAHVIHTSKDLPPGAGPLMADAMRASMERDFARAEQKYQEILRQDENNVYVLAHLANAQFAGGHLDQCEKTVLKALALDADDAASLYLLGILRYRQEKLDAALDALNRSAKFNPTNAGTQNYLGCVLADKGLRSAAESALRKALQLDPDYADAHYNLALVYAGEQPPSPSLARWHYDRAVTLGHARNPDFEKTLPAAK